MEFLGNPDNLREGRVEKLMNWVLDHVLRPPEVIVQAYTPKPKEYIEPEAEFERLYRPASDIEIIDDEEKWWLK